MNYSLYAPGLDPAFIDKAVCLLQEASEYLDDSITSKLRFFTEANLNQMVRKREGQFDLETVRQELNRHIGVIFTKARQCFEPVVFPASPAVPTIRTAPTWWCSTGRVTGWRRTAFTCRSWWCGCSRSGGTTPTRGAIATTWCLSVPKH
ncbi:MAG: hypothetical protein F4226_05585 [Synechococcus sp. SB0678_bin_12]|nr:hypothetical protein [Synechococcus sp. SB0678_bin_12]